ncbi:MAG: radical SAM protein [Deltaproteobacteria bacterium]
MYRKIHPTLPIFKNSFVNYAVIYIPGNLTTVTAARAEDLERGWTFNEWSDPSLRETLAMPLEKLAEDTIHSWQSWQQTDFLPEALIFSPGFECNASCVYCYSRGQTHAGNSLFDPHFLETAARLVAANCSAKGLPFNFAVHGEGEPTLYWDNLVQATGISQAVARQYGLDWTGYVGTNGLLSEEHLNWLGDTYSLIGISCDGSPDIQDDQRRLKNGQKTSAIVAGSIKRLISQGHSPRIRVTITPQSMRRQVEIVTYLAGELGVRDIHFEPVYRAGNNRFLGFSPEDASPFAAYFLAAEEEAARRGCSLNLSGVRPDEFHGPYCHFLNQTLHIGAPDRLLGCFFTGSGYDISLAIVKDPADGLSVNTSLMAELGKRSVHTPKRCLDCINIYHCSRNCPEFCYLDPVDTENSVPGFRCRLFKILVESWISRAALALIDNSPESDYPARLTSPGSTPAISDWLEHIPKGIDRTALELQWEAARPHFKPGPRELPAPIWVLEGLLDDSKTATKKLCGRLGSHCEDLTAMAVYIHIPFCDRKCGFCDCYSFPLNDKNRHLEDIYIRNLLHEITNWKTFGPIEQKPVSTVHLGGGTPLFLSPDNFEGLIQACRDQLGVHPDTEWALESTSSSIHPEALELMLRNNIRRLHVGVQTLEDTVRSAIGRRESRAVILDKLQAALKMDMVVSVDLVFGLPGESIEGFIDTLLELIAIGIDGFSLYQLQTSRRNQGWRQRSRDPIRGYICEYLLFQTAEHLLLQNGYKKTHFNHYSRQRDQNRYYSYPQRGEDLLGLGCSANGCLGSYHYRNHDFKGYMAAGSGNSVIMGGIEDNQEKELRSFNTALAAGRFQPEAFTDPRLQILMHDWKAAAWLAPDPVTGSYYLSGNGSWFINNMYEAIRRLT